MTNTQNLKFRLFLSILFSSLTGLAQEITMDILSKEYKEATGGEAKYQDLENYELLLTSDEKNIKTELTYAIAPDLASAKLIKSKMGRDFIYLANDTESSLYLPMGGASRQGAFRKQALSTGEAAKVKSLINEGLLSFLAPKNTDLKTASIKEQNTSAGKINILTLTGNYGTYEYHFSKNSKLLTKSIRKYKNGDVEEFQFENYQASKAGILFPKTIILLDPKTKKVTSFESTLKLNTLKKENFSVGS